MFIRNKNIYFLTIYVVQNNVHGNMQFIITA